MAADIYTKAFSDADKWQLVFELISILDPAFLSNAKYMKDLDAPFPSQGGGSSLHPPSCTQKVLLPRSVGMKIKSEVNGTTL